MANDFARPFADIGPDGLSPFGRPAGRHPSLLVVDSLTRFATCQLLKNLTSDEVSQTFANGWVKRFGEPKRIILDQGGPVIGGREWGELSHIFGWKYIRPPARAPHQNGPAKRTARSLKAAGQSIAINEDRRGPSQAALTLCVVAKNRSACAITGLPPAFSMADRCDVESGAITCMWEHGPMSRDSLIPQMNTSKDYGCAKCRDSS